MPWKPESETEIASILGVPLNGGGMVAIRSAMAVVLDPDGINLIEGLLLQWTAANAALSQASLDRDNAGLIKLDVIEWSDRAGAKLQDLRSWRDELARRIANALGLGNLQLGGGCGGRLGRVRS
jgi:hypothetical protein